MNDNQDKEQIKAERSSTFEIIVLSIWGLILFILYQNELHILTVLWFFSAFWFVPAISNRFEDDFINRDNKNE